jgi:nitrate reductase gamma subunit
VSPSKVRNIYIVISILLLFGGMFVLPLFQGGFNFVALITGTIILALNRDRLRRNVKVSYRNEYFYLIFLFVFGLLGFVVLFDNMGGNRAYIANILVVLFAGLLYLLIFLGRKYFNLDYINKR